MTYSDKVLPAAKGVSGVQSASYDFSFEPAVESITFHTGGKETALNFYLEVREKTQNPAWSAESCTATIGDENVFPTINNAGDNKFTYNSSDEAVATIATDGTITLVGAGTTVISAKYTNAENTEVTISYNLLVRAAGSAKDAAMSYSAASVGAIVGSENTLPSLSFAEGVEGITYLSSNPEVATVDENGVVTPVGKGIAIITATADEAKYFNNVASYEISVFPAFSTTAELSSELGEVVWAWKPGTAGKLTVTNLTANHPFSFTPQVVGYKTALEANVFGEAFTSYTAVRTKSEPKADDTVLNNNTSTDETKQQTWMEITPETDMTLVLVYRRQSDLKNNANTFAIGSGKDLKLKNKADYSNVAASEVLINKFDAGSCKIKNDNNVEFSFDNPYAYAYVAEKFELKAGETYITWATGTTIQLRGVAYILPTLAAPVHGHGVDGTETEIELPSNTEIKLSHDDADANIMWRWVGETANDPAGDAPEVVALADEAAPADGEWKNYNDEKPLFNHDKDMTLEFYAEKNGVKSETKNLLVKLAETVGIADINVDNANAPVEYFNLQGIRVDNPSNGIFIRRQGNEVSKVIIK